MSSKRKTHEMELILDGKKWLCVIDDVTGEVIEKYSLMPRKNKTGFPEGEFRTVSVRFDMFLLEKYHEYSKLEFGVLSWMQSKIGFNNRVEFFRQQELADALKTNQAHVSRSLKRLTADGIIKRDGHHYVFAPKYIKYSFDKKGGEENTKRLFDDHAPPWDEDEADG